MFKKITSLILVFLLSCLTPITVFSAAAPLLVEENDVLTPQEESQFAGLNANTSESITTESDQLLLDSEYIITTKVDSEYAKWLCSAPDEILSASTIELLEYFIQTPFMGQQVLTLLSSPVPNSNKKPDYTCHEAFRELISRDDFIDALEIYAAKKLCTSASDELNYDNKVFEKLLTESSVDALLSAPTYSIADHPNLQRMRDTSNAVTTAVGDYVGNINNIDYYSAGTISTVNNRDVVVCTPNRELTSSEIADYNNQCDYVGNTRIADPTAVYNCHSYAWYRYSTSNPYWIMSISQFLLDNACTPILSLSDVQAKDIIVYCDSNDMILHSGVVQSISSSGELTICSKWGQAGVYQHSLGNIPAEYYADYSGGVIRYSIFRYHDYTNRYTGDEYHSGSQHYFRYADICDICNKETNESWISIDCMGPPCYVPWSIGTVVSRSKKTYKL